MFIIMALLVSYWDMFVFRSKSNLSQTIASRPRSNGVNSMPNSQSCDLALQWTRVGK